MTVKTAVSFTDKHHEFAKKMVEEGTYASVSSVVAAGIEQVIRDDEEREIALQAMKKTIESRMALPREQWIDFDKDDIFERAKQRLKDRQPR